MPDLSQSTIDDLNIRLEKILKSKNGYHTPTFLDAGGSAAVYRVETPNGTRAFKVFDPKFFSEEEGSKEPHRLALQERLIGHQCDSLVQTFSIEIAENTAFVEMEFIEWPQLKRILNDIPDDAIQNLILQLIAAVEYLESLNIVHRDIKPENIHISSDFKNLKLLDLGVVREFDPGPNAEETDHGSLRVFLATAQYSPPEYLFRLDAPSEDLWRALNLYQVGAVLHDLIMKEAIFQAEIDTGNRWLVAKAVLLKQPQFVDGNPSKMAKLKAVAAKCLTKDMHTRLQIVNWADFSDETKDPLLSLRQRLNSRHTSKEARLSREINFYREEFKEKVTTKIRESLIAICKTDLPFELSNAVEKQQQIIDLTFDIEKSLAILVRITFDWQNDIYKNNVKIIASSCLIRGDVTPDTETLTKKIICITSIDASIDEPSNLICIDIADITSFAIDLIDGSDAAALSKLNNFDILANK